MAFSISSVVMACLQTAVMIIFLDLVIVKGMGELEMLLYARSLMELQAVFSQKASQPLSFFQLLHCGWSAYAANRL